MSVIEQLVDQLHTLQVRLWEEDGKLRVSAPEGVLTPALVDQLKAQKAALLDHVRRAMPSPAVRQVVADPSVRPQPLSFAQERLWFLETMGGVGAAYNVAAAVRIAGPLRAEALAQAFADVQHRHAVLRAQFVDVDGVPAQQARPGIEDLQHVDCAGDAQAAVEAARAQAQQPFDIAADRLVRATLYRITADDHLLAVTLHHLISDGGSLGILVRELVDHYQAAVRGESMALPPLAFQYSDFARSQRDWLQGEDVAREVQYWRDQLLDAPEAITLPVDRPRPGVTTFVGANAPVVIPPTVAEAVRQYATRTGATPFMVFLSAYAYLLCRTAGQDEVVIGVPVAERSVDGTDALIGLFVNALPIRVACGGDATFASLVESVKTTVLDALAHGDVPWEFLLDALQPRRDLSRAPLFQVTFTLQEDPAAELQIPGLTFAPVPMSTGAAKFEWSFELQPTPDGGCAGVLEYNTDLFDAATIAEVVERFQRVVEAGLRAPTAPLSTIDLVDQSERAALIGVWSGPVVPFDLSGSLSDLFLRNVDEHPSRAAVVLGAREVTWAELDQMVAGVGQALLSRGVRVGDRVGVVVDRTPETIANLLGVIRAGGAYVPIDPAWPDPRRLDVIGRAGCVAVIDSTGITARDADTPWPQVGVDTPAYVLFTSGSTGTPKGVVVEQHSLRHLIEALEFAVYQPLGLREDCRVSVNGALTFDTSVKQVFQLLQGRTLVLVPEEVRLDGAALLDYAAQTGIDVLDATPSQLSLLVDAGLGSTTGSIRAVLSGGEALTPALWQKLRGPAAPVVVNLYGPTECTVDATAHILDRRDEAPVLGRPLPNMQVCILDATLRPMPIGMPGEIVIGGSGVARGYLGDPDATAAQFITSPLPEFSGSRMYRTGDRGRVRADGRLEYLGRMDDQVKVRGHRVELGEIERVLEQQPGVRAACALVTDDQRLVAAVAVDPLCNPVFEGRDRYALPNGLAVVQLNPNETDFLYGEMFERNAYLRHGVHLHDNAIVVDVGSNIGMFAMSAHVQHAGLRLLCVEPNPHVRALLEANLRLLGADATVRDCGIAAADGVADFTFYPGLSILSGLYADAEEERAVVRSYVRRQEEGGAEQIGDEAEVEEVISQRLRPVTLPVRLRPLGDVLEESGISRIDLLKINVEKAELDVLMGIRASQWAHIQQVTLELHDVDGRLNAALTLLREHGFTVTVDEDWSLERAAGTNYYLYAVRPGTSPAAAPDEVREARLASFTRPLVSAESVRTFAGTRLPEYMVPEVVQVLDRLPLTAHGKTDRRGLSRLPWTRVRDNDGSTDEPLTADEQRLAAVWMSVLAVDRVGRHDHFFHSGGHSLTAARLAGRIRETSQVPFTVGAVFDHPVLSDMAAFICTLGDEAPLPALVAHGWDAALPLSYAQERMLFLEQLEGGGGAYVISGAMTLSGVLQQDALQNALQDVVRRHPVLRSIFPATDTPAQARLLDARVALDIVDWSTLSTQPDLHQWVRDQAAVAFNLADALPIRVTLLRLSETEHVLSVACHHLVADGWSVAIFLRDLSASYRHHVGASPDPLGLIPIGYYDYARWQRAWLSSQRLATSLGYWTNRLSGSAPFLDLPTDHPRPTLTSYKGGAIGVSLAPGVRRRVEQCANDLGATPYMVLLATFGALLHRWTGQADVVIGSPVAGRSLPGTEDIIGLFVNTLVMRLDFEGTQRFDELMAQVRQSTRDALEHEDVPFERIVEALRPPRRLNRHPIFQVMFALQNLPVSSLDLPGVRWTPLAVETPTAKFDLSLVVDEVDDGYRATFEYASDLFDGSTIERLSTQFTMLLDTVLSSPTVVLPTVPLTTATDIAMVTRWNDTGRDYGPFVPAHRIVEQQTRRFPDAIALTYHETSLTYAEMWRRVRHVAAAIRTYGIRPGQIVAYYTDRSPAWLLSMLAILEARAVFLPIDPDFPDDRVRWMLDDSEAALVVTQRGLWSALTPADGEARARPVLFLEDLPWERDPITLPTLPDPTPDDPAYVIYTSGSTGRPKGAVNAHRGLTNLTHNFVEFFETSTETQALHFSSISFDSSLCEVLMALAIGGTACLADREEILPGDPLESLLKRKRITHATIPPSALGGMADPDLPDLQALISAGEVCPPEVVQRWGGPRRFFNAYGPTESSVCSIVARCRPEDDRVTIGRPLRNVHVFILDPAGHSMPVGMPGEMAIGGEGVALGYLRRPELTAERFIMADPLGTGTPVRLYLTGDQARYLNDGRVDFLGRKDNQIKLRGYRIELGEIETALRSHASVRDCAVVVQDAAGGQKRLVAFVVADGPPATARVLKEHLRARLPEYMVPPVFVELERIPQTTNLKRDTKALERWSVVARHEEDEDAGPVSDSTRTVAGIFAEVLERQTFGVRDDFFEHGGHSLLAARVIGRVRERLGAELTLRALFEAPTPESLAALADQAVASSWPAVVHGPTPESRAVVSGAQKRLWFVDLLNRDGGGDAADSTAYTIVAAARLQGPINIEAFRRAVDRLSWRHEVLRSVYPSEQGEPVVHVRDSVNPLRMVDVPQSTKATQWEVAISQATADSRVPFDLATGPLFRPVLYRLTDTDHLFVASMHHIVSDGWSVGVLVRELAASYEAACAGQPLAPTAGALQYGDYARWWDEVFHGPQLERQLQYWRDRLVGVPQHLVLPTDRPRPLVQTFRGGVVTFELDADVLDGLAKVGAGAQASQFMTVLAAFMTWVARYSGQSSFMVGTPVANRRGRDLESLVGLFANTLPLRASVPADASFRQVLGSVRADAIDALSHPDLPFDAIVQAVQPDRDLSRAPLFQVMFAMSSGLIDRLTLQDLTIDPVSISTGSAKFDLTMFVEESSREGALTATLEYNADLFDAATAERMVAGFRTLLHDIVARPDVPTRDLRVLSGSDLERLELWNATETSVPAGHVCDWFEAQVDRAPDAVAIQWTDAWGVEGLVSYGDLDRRANQLARSLRARGVGPDTLVAVCLERTPDLIVALLAILKAGGAYVPIDSAYPAARIAFMVADSGVRLVISTEAQADRLPDEVRRRATVVMLDVEAQSLARLSGARLDRAVGGDHLAYMIYTSGSTGTPKGVLIEHRGLSNYLAWAVRAYAMTEGRGAPVAGSISFDATITSVFGPLVAGQRLVLIPEGQEIDALSRPQIAHADYSFYKITPSHLDAVNVATQAAAPGTPLTGRVRQLVIGGEELTGATLAPWKATAPDVVVTNEYGPTETVVGCVVYTRRAAEMPDGVVPIGRPIANTQIYLLDANQQPVPIGTVGEMYIAGAGVARGYHMRPELTAERFVTLSLPTASGIAKVRCYRTGDLARWTGAGDLLFLGRIDTQVKLRGHRIELGEIDATAMARADVAQAAAVVQSGAGVDPRLILYVVPAGGATVDVDGLLTHLRAGLPAIMVPQVVRTIDTFPLTANGKLDRPALAALDVDESESEVSRALPSAGDVWQDVVADVWTLVLGAPPATPDSDFFEAGGHSLVAARFVAHVRDRCDVDLPVRAVFEHPTWRGLAQAIATARRGTHVLPPLVRSTEAPVLSFGQARLWALEQFDDTGAAYHIPAAYTLTGPVDVDALTRAWQTVVSRHDVLRSRVPSVDGRPVLVIDTQVPSIPIVSPDAFDATLAAPFSLAEGPLARAVLARVDQDTWLFGVVLHHMVSDGWSSGVLARELHDAYTGQGTADPLPFQYADYAAWQRRVLQGPTRARLESFWQQTLDGAPATMTLPTDHPRPATQSYRGGVVTFHLPTSLRDRLQRVAREYHATLYMTLLSAYATLLAQWSGQDDVVVGTTVANRSLVGTEGLIGFFVNTVPLRMRVGQAVTLGDLLTQTRQTTLQAFDHQDLPFEQLVEAVNPPRNPVVTPVFQTLFTYQHADAATLTLPGVDVMPREMPHTSAKFDVTLAIDDRSTGLEGFIEFNADVFDVVTIEAVARRFEACLLAIVDDPEMKREDVSLLTSADSALLATWNDTAFEFGEPRLIHQIISDQARLTPDAVALRFEGQTLSYRDLDSRSNAVAAELQRLGVGPDVLVGLCLERSLELLIGVLGILKSGGAYVPLDPEYPAQRLAGMMEDAEMRVLVTRQSILDRGVLPATEGVSHVLLEADFWTQAETPLMPSALDASHLAYCIFTSGSTGRPKGATISHGAIRNRLLWMQDSYALDASDVVLHKTPVSFDVSVWELFWPLMFGATTVIARPGGHRDAAYLTSLIADTSVTTLHFVPSMLQAFLEEPAVTTLSSLRRAFASGEALSWETARRWAALVGCPLHNLYGPTEAAVDVTAWTCHLGDTPHVIPIGRPIANTRIHILDAHQRLTPIGVPGELYISGANLARGYINQPDLTAERFVQNPFANETGESARLYRTGDLARWRADGQIEFLGRMDAQVKLRGFRVELGEIETALRQHPHVADAAVSVVTPSGGAPRLVAYLVVRPSDAAIDMADVRRHLHARVPDYMVPSAFMTLDALPLGPSGKLDRRLLPAPTPTAATTPTGGTPQSPREVVMTTIWQDVTGVTPIGRDQNFFELGGDSIQAIQVAARARQQGLHVTPALLMEHQTVATLCAAVGVETRVIAEEGTLTGAVPLAPIVHWFVDLGYEVPQHFNQAVVLSTPAGLRGDLLERALWVLTDHHDALRLRGDAAFGGRTFGSGETAVGTLHYGSARCAWAFTHVSVKGLDAAEQVRAIERIADQMQSSLSPSAGPLWRVTYVTGEPDQPGRLIWVAHHLAVDGVSWGILVEDLARVVEQLAAGQPPVLPAKSSSWRQWSQAWADAAADGRLEAQRKFWLSQATTEIPLPPLTSSPAVTRHDRVAITSPRVSQDQVLAAFWAAWTDVIGAPTVAIDVEGHGRVAPVPEIDVTRTVGWFTAVYPLVFTLPDVTADRLDVVRTITGNVPDGGVGFGALKYLAHDPALVAQPRPAVLFNFLGRLDDLVSPANGFGPTDENTGASTDPRNRSPYALELVSAISDGHLDLHWRSPENGLGAEVVSALATRMAAHLPSFTSRGTAQTTATRYEPLVLLPSATVSAPDTPPLFLIHPAGGTVMSYAPLAHRLNMPVYGVQAPGLAEGETPERTVSALARLYVDAIIRFWPSGPYRIGGWSYGGIVAFEMYRQLMELGRTVDLLLILDTLAPGAMPSEEWQKSSGQLLAGIFGEDIGLTVADLEGRPLDEQLQRVTDRAIAAQIFPEGYSVDAARRNWAVFEAHRHAEQTYEATPANGRVVVVASDLRRADADHTLGWGRWMSAVEVVPVAGNHQQILRVPSVDVLAAAVNDRCRSR
jgi:amino acid adenylation domain-containing protein/FkbM family methyltransferase/non-ribosomal peptide synthase protein (TIGR01720 family)